MHTTGSVCLFEGRCLQVEDNYGILQHTGLRLLDLGSMPQATRC